MAVRTTGYIWQVEGTDHKYKRIAYFDVNSRTAIVVDVSPVGLSAVLIQLQGVEWRVIAYASRDLTDVERRYRQREREGLALVWACERFRCTFVEGILN